MNDDVRAALTAKHGAVIPPLVLASLLRYMLDRVPPGDFLRAVLCNDLKNAVVRADAESLAALKPIVQFCYWELPGGVWGNREKVRAWLDGATMEAAS